MMQALTPEFGHANEIFSHAMNFDLSEVTSRYVKDHKTSEEEAQLHEIECRRYLFLCALFPDERLGMRGPVDNYWHTFLLFTKQYSTFCDRVANSFIHHFPAAQYQPDSGFSNTMRRYRSVFGLEPDSRAWPAFLSTDDCDNADDIPDRCSDGPGPDDCTPVPSCSGEPEPK